MVKTSLDKHGVSVLTFLVRKLGYSRTPQAVPLVFIQTGLKRFYNIDLSIDQIQYRIQKLILLGHLEKWSTKHHTHYKTTYYRIPYLIKDHTHLPNTQNNLPQIKKTPPPTRETTKNHHIPTPHTLSGVSIEELKKVKEKFRII